MEKDAVFSLRAHQLEDEEDGGFHFAQVTFAIQKITVDVNQ